MAKYYGTMSQPEYETRFVTVPVITAPRRRSLPNQLGPWPIKRSKSEAEIDSPTSMGSFHDPFENGRPSLAAVLAKVDEECAHIDMMSMEDGYGGRTTFERDEYFDKEGTNEYERYGNLSEEETRTDIVLTSIQGACTAIATALVPIMIFVYARHGWVNIALREAASSVQIFFILLSSIVVMGGMKFTVDCICGLAMRYNWRLLETEQMWLFVGVGFGVGLTLWCEMCVSLSLVPIMTNQ